MVNQAMSYPNKVLYTVMMAGVSLLESGAETSRVEDTVVRLATAFHLSEASCFCSQTGLMFSGYYEGESYAQVARVSSRNTNLDRISKLNDCSRNAYRMSIDELNDEIVRICKEPVYSMFLNCLFGGLGAFGFVFVYNGHWNDALCAFVLGVFTRYLTMKLSQKNINTFFNMCVSSFPLTFLSFGATHFGVLSSPHITIVGTIMLLVPGLAITNAIKDIISGDLVSGIARIVEAFLIAVALAVGSGLAMMAWLALGYSL